MKSKYRMTRIAGALIVVLLILVGLRFATRGLPTGGGAMAMAAYANADALADLVLNGGEHDR